MALDQLDKVALRVAAERGLAEMGVGRDETVRRHFEIGEVASSAAGDQDLLAGPIRMIEQQHAPAALPGRQRAHQPGRPGSHDRHVEGFHRRGQLAIAPADYGKWRRMAKSRAGS